MRFFTYTQACLRHAIRSKFLLVLIAFTTAAEYFALRILQSMTIQTQGEVSTLSQTQLLHKALVIQVLAGFLISTVYGLWMIPYAHRGARAALTHVLPLSRAAMAGAYALALSALVLVQGIITFFCTGLVCGWGFIFSSQFPFGTYLAIQVFVAFVLQFVAALLALGSLTFGQVVTFVLATFCFSALQLAGTFFRIEMVQIMGAASDSWQKAKSFYDWLPPIGEALYHVGEVFWNQRLSWVVIGTWASWWLLLQGLLILRLRYASLGRNEE